MVHLFSRLDKYILIDIESGSLFELERRAFFVASKRYGHKLSAKEAREASLIDSQTEREINEDLDNLEHQGLLNTKAVLPKKSDAVPLVKSMCFNISHNCNLRCKYCFADEGKYGGKAQNMSIETAKSAVDFLIENSGKKRNLEIDFFGGEPLLNMEAVRFTVDYARARAKETGKVFKFTLTTNATLLNDETIRYINENMSNVVLSIDGRESVHNSMRPNALGRDSFKTAFENSKKLVGARNGKEYYVRGTFTSKNLDFTNDVTELARHFDNISIEPVVLPKGHELAISEEHIEQIKTEYTKLAEEYLKLRKQNPRLNFFHFNYNIYEGPCVLKRLSGCGAGGDYLAVSADGRLYPCHQFIGNPEYCAGDVFSGLRENSRLSEIRQADITKKEDCTKCWAKYYCGGGCHANAETCSGSVFKPHELMCALMRERIECAIAIKIAEKP